MTMMRGEWSQLMAPGLHDTFVHWLALKQRTEEFSHVFNMETSDRAYENEVEFGGLGPMPEKPEGESISYQDAIQGGTVQYLHTSYGLGCRTSWELYSDDQYNLIMQVPKALARSAHFTKEQKAWNIFNLGFTTVVTSDGVSLFNVAHPLLGGPNATAVGPGLTVGVNISAAGTYPNRPLTDVDLSFTAIQTAINQFERLIDDQGLPIQLKPKYLVIPPELKWIAREILGSPHKPYTADNEINAVLAEDLGYFISHYLTSTSAWFMTCDKSEHYLKHFDREMLDEDFSDDFDTRSIKQISFYRASDGATSWIGTWGSNGP